MAEALTAVASLARERGPAGTIRQVYSTTLLDFDGGRTLEWAYVPAALLEWEGADLGRTLQAMELELFIELPSISALPAAIAAMLQSSPDPAEITVRLRNLLGASLGSWTESVEPPTLAFAQYAAFSAVLPVEWSPLEKVPVPDAVVGAAAAGIPAGAAGASALAVAGGVHGAALILVGAGGAIVGTVAFPIAAVGGGLLAWRLMRRWFREPGTA